MDIDLKLALGVVFGISVLLLLWQFLIYRDSLTTPPTTQRTPTPPTQRTPTPPTPQRTPTPPTPPSSAQTQTQRECSTSDHESDIYELIVNDPLLSNLNPEDITDQQAKDYILRILNSEDNHNISVMDESGRLIPLTRNYIDIYEIYNFLDQIKINFKFNCSSNNQCCLNE